MKLRRVPEEIARSCTSIGSASIPAAPCPGMRLLTGRGIAAVALSGANRQRHTRFERKEQSSQNIKYRKEGGV